MSKHYDLQCKKYYLVRLHLMTNIIKLIRMYVCSYVCMFVCMYVRMYVCMYVYIDTRQWMHGSQTLCPMVRAIPRKLLVYLCLYLSIPLSLCMHVHVCVYITWAVSDKMKARKEKKAPRPERERAHRYLG
jgi:hypothetical protein